MLDATKKQNERWGNIELLVRTSHWHFSFVLHKNVSCTCSPHTLRWFKENSCKNNGYMEGRLLQGRTGKKVAASWNCSVLGTVINGLGGIFNKIKHLVKQKDRNHGKLPRLHRWAHFGQPVAGTCFQYRVEVVHTLFALWTTLKALRFENDFKDMLTKPKGRNQSSVGWDSASREHAIDLSGIPSTHDERRLDTKNDSEHKVCVCVCACWLHRNIRWYDLKPATWYRGNERWTKTKQSSQDIFPGHREMVSATLVTPSFSSFHVWFFRYLSLSIIDHSTVQPFLLGPKKKSH